MADGNQTDGPEILWVKSALPRDKDGGDRVVLSEYDTNHPSEDHWVFVAGSTPVQVARTALVEARLRDGTMVKADDPNAPAKPSAAATPAKA